MPINSILSWYIIISYPVFAMLIWWTVNIAKSSGSFLVIKMVWAQVKPHCKTQKIIFIMLFANIIISVPVTMPFILSWRLSELFSKKKTKKSPTVIDETPEMTISPDQPDFEDAYNPIDLDEQEKNQESEN